MRYLIPLMFLLTIASGVAAEPKMDLSEDYLGIELGSSVADVKQRIPVECYDDDKKKNEVSCFYEGNLSKNKKYRLLKKTKNVALTFIDNRLMKIFVSFGDSCDSFSFLQIMELNHGSPVVTVTPPSTLPIKSTTYLWENTRVINKIMSMTGRNLINGAPFDVCDTTLVLKN